MFRDSDGPFPIRAERLGRLGAPGSESSGHKPVEPEAAVSAEQGGKEARPAEAAAPCAAEGTWGSAGVEAHPVTS